MDGAITICALFYGDHTELAQRCLDSVQRSLQKAGGLRYVREVRLGLNAVSSTTADYLAEWSRLAGLPVIWYRSSVNVYKYPLMRRMFYDAPLESPWAMWLDDDSYFDHGPGWWPQLLSAAQACDMLGQHWFLPLKGNQWDWMQRQPWYNPQAGLPPLRKGRPMFKFCQGAWWLIRTQVLAKYDWPIPELRHCGGDSLLGELFRHQGLRMGRFADGVRINADNAGRHSKAARRGYSEPEVGSRWEGEQPDLAHHDFEIEVKCFHANDC